MDYVRYIRVNYKMRKELSYACASLEIESMRSIAVAQVTDTKLQNLLRLGRRDT